jgi:3-deoxy-D-manno-octulosonic acid kinase
MRRSRGCAGSPPESLCVRPLIVAVLQTDTDVDAGPALASVPAARRYVVRPPGLSAPPPLDVEVLTVAAVEREAAAAAVRQVCPEARVVVLAADERVTCELARRLAVLGDEPGRWTAGVRVRFLGEEIETEREVIAWAGETERGGPSGDLGAAVLKLAGSVTDAIAALDAEATHAARVGGTADIVDLLWRPLWGLLRRLGARRRHGMPGVILSILETYRDVLTAAKAWERSTTERAAARVPAGFRSIGTPGGFVLLRDGASAVLERVVLAAEPDEVQGEPLTGAGRGASWCVAGDAGERGILRWYRRGGMVRHVARDRFFGWRPRPLRELIVTEEARRRGVAAPEVLAARVDRLALGCYRGALLTRAIEGAMPLAEVLRAHPPAVPREPLMTAVGHALRVLHDRGIQHRDLNAGNILVAPGGPEPVVWVIDFDRARLLPRLSRRRRRRALARLERSLAKLERAGVSFGAGERGCIERGYWAA